MKNKTDTYNLFRFVKAQAQSYQIALKEIEAGKKHSHWMWYVFPQLKGLGHSSFSEYYGISGIAEATVYLNHPYLGAHLREITEALLKHEGKSAVDIMGGTDALKLRSCMTLFDVIAPDDCLRDVLKAFYFDKSDEVTLSKL